MPHTLASAISSLSTDLRSSTPRKPISLGLTFSSVLQRQKLRPGPKKERSLAFSLQERRLLGTGSLFPQDRRNTADVSKVHVAPAGLALATDAGDARADLGLVADELEREADQDVAPPLSQW